MALFLFILGAVLGSFANWAIYNCGYFNRRPISPLGPLDPQASPRQWPDYLPILGWLWMRRDHRVHGSGFWIRPLLIELAMAAAAVFYYRWLVAGGLLGHVTVPTASDAEFWWAAHFLLFSLLVIATFIDFDERTIPDWITIPGTIAGLIFAVSVPSIRLPEVVGLAGGMSYRPITFVSPNSIVDFEWHRNWRGVAAGIAVVWVWVVALTPKTVTWRRGLIAGVRLMVASIVRPRRRRPCDIRLAQRGPYGFTLLLVVIGMVLSLLVVIGWLLGGESWDCLYGSLMGLAFGGALVWSVRLIAGYAMQQEAMGFGDVTLMAMIGSILGWQATLLIFGIAPFAALFVHFSQYLFSKNREIAFGPYLSLGTVILVIGWFYLWQGNVVFVMGDRYLFAWMAALLASLGLILAALRWMRG